MFFFLFPWTKTVVPLQLVRDQRGLTVGFRIEIAFETLKGLRMVEFRKAQRRKVTTASGAEVICIWGNCKWALE